MQVEEPLGGVASVASKGVAREGFRICGKYRGYGRNLGSVARKRLSRLLAKGRKRMRGTKEDRAARAHGSGPGTGRTVPHQQNQYTTKYNFVKVNISGLNAWSYEWAESSFVSLRSLRARI